MGDFTAKGRAGCLRIGGRQAASLQNWSLNTTEDGWEAHAQVVSGTEDTYLMGLDEGFELRLDVGKRQWCWKDVRVHGEHDIVITGVGHPLVR